MPLWVASPKYVTPCEGVGVEIQILTHVFLPLPVTPCEGVGVEMHQSPGISMTSAVTPCEGVGVEIILGHSSYTAVKSRLARAWE